jgi:hypothetical protein
MAKMMKYEVEDGEDVIWMHKENQSVSQQLMGSNYFHVDVQE